MITKTLIVELLNTNDKAVGRALVALYARQTESEKSAETTINLNGEGFTPADAFVGSSMAQFFAARGYLTEKQLAYWRKPNAKGTPRICKYAGQLLLVAEAKAAMA
jgi:hypothetical protein